MTGHLVHRGACLIAVALGAVAGCGGADDEAASTQPVSEPPNGPVAAAPDGPGRPAFRAGSPKPWEGGAVSGAVGWSVHPGGSIQNRVRLVAWSSAGVGAPITVSLVHDAARAGESRAAGKGFRLAVGALLTRTDDGLDVEEPDGTHRRFTRNADGTFAAEAFDTDRITPAGAGFFLDSLGGERRLFLRIRGTVFRETIRVDRTGDVVTILYDLDNYPTEIRDSVGRRAVFKRAPGGRYETITDVEGRVFRLVYTGDDLTEIQAPAVDGAVPRLRLAYDAGHRIVSRSSWGDQNATTFAYDDAGRVTRVVLPERYQYFDFGWTDTSFTLADAFGRSARYVYADGALVESTDARGLVTAIERDARRRAVTITDPRGRITRLTHDERDDLVAVTDASGRTTQTSYDARHRPIAVRDALGGVTSYTYDAFDGMTSATNPRGETTRWERDEVGNVVRVVDFAGRVRMTATYDGRGRLLTRTGATGRTETVTYDAYGTVATIQGIDGRVTRQTSTPAGAPLEIANGLGEVAQFAYDPLGRLATASNSSGSLTFGYDLDNRMVSLTDATAGSPRRLEMAYTPDGRIARQAIGGVTLQAAAEQISGVP